MNAVLHTATDTARDEVFMRRFARIRSDYRLYPDSSGSPSAALESVAGTVRSIAADCLPLGLAIVMHLYPLCALQCAPLPALSVAGFKRRILMKYVRDEALIIANAGSERSRGAHSPMQASLAGRDGVRITGTFDYVSLASVADVVLFSVPLDDTRSVFCAADLRGESVRIGDSRFSGSMRLADTRSVTFLDHRVGPGRILLVNNAADSRCIFDYQRCWFHLLLAEAYLARIDTLRLGYSLPQSPEQRMTRNEVSCLREYARSLLEDCVPGGGVDAVSRVTATLKLRVSTMAQETARQLRELVSRGADAGVDSHAAELGYMKHQPTPDDRILGGLA